jgi:pimeloyl-ACP methyl ester carboxylesterase
MIAPGKASLAFDRFGEGEPLVLIHGIGSRRGAWKPAAEIVAREREVIAIDLPGFGDSPVDGSSSVEDFTACVQAFFAEQGLERPHVGGNSLGGGIGFELARRGAARSLTAFSPIGLWSAGERPVNPLALVYLNRLSDLLFILARAANAGEEPLWKPGGGAT